FDYEANTAFGEDAIITLPDSQVKAALITTDEEIVIARDTMHIVMSEEEN
ncbi:MAG: acetate kinase, partial [Candidatus Cryptobacteroides sp.]|nr:acetate kinase [Candidatus Cryptobacteroides sp.]